MTKVYLFISLCFLFSNFAIDQVVSHSHVLIHQKNSQPKVQTPSHRVSDHRKHNLHGPYRMKRSISSNSINDALSATQLPDLAAASPDVSPRIYSLHVNTDVYLRFATTQITSRLVNPSVDHAQELTFTATLPNSAFISNFSMQIGDDIIVGQVKEKEVANREYTRAKAAGQTAGQVVQKPRETNNFGISINVAAGDKVTFNLTYQEMLQRVHGVYKQITNIQAGQVVNDMKVTININEDSEIVKVFVPKFGPKTGEMTNKELLELDAAENVKLTSTTIADHSNLKVIYSPTPQDQEAQTLAQMVVLYDVVRRPDAGEIKVVNGYFVHFFAPTGLQPVNKHIIIVIDKSGSMRGRKLVQTKEAMRVLLNDLDPSCYFNILTFGDRVEKWNTESVAAVTDNVQQAIAFVDQINAFGGTNINLALTEAINLVKSTQTPTLTSLILFLTDGEATTGITDSSRILENIAIQQAQNSAQTMDNVYIEDELASNDVVDDDDDNGGNTASSEANSKTNMVSIHSIGFGNNADFDLLQKISVRNRGLARKVYEDSDAALQLAGFFAEITDPVLTDVDIKYLNETVAPESIVEDTAYMLYNGGERVIVGKLKNSNSKKLTASVNGISLAGPVRFRAECVIPRPFQVIVPEDTPYQPMHANTLGGMIERVWAFQTIKQLLSKSKYGTSNDTETGKLRQKALELSLKYNFVTELTSMIVVMPNSSHDGDDDDDVKEPQLVREDNAKKSRSNNFRNSPLSYSRRQNYGRSGPVAFPHVIVAKPPRGSASQSSYGYQDYDSNSFPVAATHSQMIATTITTTAPTTTVATVPSLEVNQGLETKSVAEGEEVLLKCEFTSNIDLKFRWLKDDEEVEQKPGRIVISSVGLVTTLHIRRVELSDAGGYECDATNTKHGMRVSSIGRLQVRSGNNATTAAPSHRRKRSARSPIPVYDCGEPTGGCRYGCFSALTDMGCMICAYPSQYTIDNACMNVATAQCKEGCRRTKDIYGCDTKCYCPDKPRETLPLRLVTKLQDKSETPVCVDYNVAPGDMIPLFVNNGTEIYAKIDVTNSDQYRVPIIGKLKSGAAWLQPRVDYIESLDGDFKFRLRRNKFKELCPCHIAKAPHHYYFTNMKDIVSYTANKIPTQALPKSGLFGLLAYVSKNGVVNEDHTMTLPIDTNNRMTFPVSRISNSPARYHFKGYYHRVECYLVNSNVTRTLMNMQS